MTLSFGELKINRKSLFFIRAVLLGDLLDGDAHLVAQVPPSIHHTICSFTQNHLVSILIGLIDVL